MSEIKITGEYPDLDSLHRAGHRTYADQMVQAIELIGAVERRHAERDAELDHEHKTATDSLVKRQWVCPRFKGTVEFADDCRIMLVNGKRRYRLTRQQAAIVRVLLENPYCEATTQTIKKQTRCGSISDSFRSGDGRKIWEILITAGHPKGFYRLNLKPKN